MTPPARKRREALQAEFRAAIEWLDAARLSAEAAALAEIEVEYKRLRRERFEEYVAARDATGVIA